MRLIAPSAISERSYLNDNSRLKEANSHNIMAPNLISLMFKEGPWEEDDLLIAVPAALFNKASFCWMKASKGAERTTPGDKGDVDWNKKMSM